MSAEIETSIWLALVAHLEDAADGRAIVQPAEEYTPTPGTDFLDVGRVDSPPERVLLNGGAHRRRGTFIVTPVCALGQDSAFYLQTAAAIASHFAEDTQLRYNGVCVRVTARPHVAEGYRDGGWFRTPVLIRWESLT